MVVAVVAMLTGCVRAEPIPTPPPTSAPTPTATPLFASDAEALAAATAAYAAYVAMSDKILMQGGVDPGRIEEVTTNNQLTVELNGYRAAAERGLHSSGGTTFDQVALERYDTTSPDGRRVVALYLCEDVSKVDVVDANGISVVTSTRPNRVKYEVQFDESPRDSGALRVSQKAPWRGGQC
ncbi:hypothetical protein [Lacisediminihabitans sp.]|uniref:hypothetical protein n=1 Tax=Lacisediminihabitans sp. TaxID=2787631 RepID=UPI002F93B33B